MNITYDGIRFSGEGELHNLLFTDPGVHGSGMSYNVPVNINICDSDCGHFTNTFCPLQLYVKFEDMEVSGGTNTNVISNVNYSVTPSDENIYTQHLGSAVYVGFPISILTTEKEYSITLKWTSTDGSTSYSASEIVTITTPEYWTKTTISNLIGTSNRGNITYTWDLEVGYNNPVKAQNIIIFPYGKDVPHQPGTMYTARVSPATNIFEFKEGSKNYIYEIQLAIIPTHGASTSLFLPERIYNEEDEENVGDYANMLKWLVPIMVKTKDGWKESSGLFTKTESGWHNFDKISIKTASGWTD